MPPSTSIRIQLATRRHWPADDVLEYYDLPEAFLTSLQAKYPGLVQDDLIDRFLLEQVLQSRRIAGLLWVALDFGVAAESLREALATELPDASSTPEARPFPVDQYAIDSKYVLPLDMVKAWVTGRMPRFKVWRDLDSYAHDMATVLGVTPLTCSVSVDAQEEPPAVATERCIATWDFISVAHAEYVDNGKPIQLAPDRVGWHAIRAGSIRPEQLYSPSLDRMTAFYESLAA